MWAFLFFPKPLNSITDKQNHTDIRALILLFLSGEIR